MKTINYKGVSITQACKNDANGNGRLIVNFLDFLNESDKELSFDAKYALAYKRARRIGFRTYRNKEYGGGFCCIGYLEVQDDLNRVCGNILAAKSLYI